MNQLSNPCSQEAPQAVMDRVSGIPLRREVAWFVAILLLACVVQYTTFVGLHDLR